MGGSGMGTTMKLVVNTLLGLGMQALAEAIALGERAGIGKNLLLDVLDQTAVLTPGEKSKLQNVRQEQYPATFALSLMHKDFSLVLEHGVSDISGNAGLRRRPTNVRRGSGERDGCLGLLGDVAVYGGAGSIARARLVAKRALPLSG